MLADPALRPVLSADSGGVRPDECGQTPLMVSLHAENARLRQEVEHLRADAAWLHDHNVRMQAIAEESHEAAKRYSALVDEARREAADTDVAAANAEAELIVTRGALEAVLALHLDAYGYCTHCRCAHPCSTVAAIETGSQQAREWLWQLREGY